MPHYSIFDLLLSCCDITLNTIDENTKNLVNVSNTKFTQWKQNQLFKSCSSYIINSPMGHIKNNNSLAFHLNTIMFAHDTNLLSLKKEDSFLLCANSIKDNDTLVYFNDNMKFYQCDKIEKIKLDYSIPNELTDNNQDKNGVAIFCYNKTIGQDLISSLELDNIVKITKLPDNIDSLNKELNQYKIFIEFDPFSIINALCAIACGGISIVMDPNKLLSQYSNINNLYIVHSIDELQNIMKTNLKFNTDQDKLETKYRNFTNFTETVMDILKNNQRKAFLL